MIGRTGVEAAVLDIGNASAIVIVTAIAEIAIEDGRDHGAVAVARDQDVRGAAAAVVARVRDEADPTIEKDRENEQRSISQPISEIHQLSS